MNQDTTDRLTQNINKMMNSSPMLRDLMQSFQSQQADYKYYRYQDSKDRYFYTTKKINHKGHPRYVAGIYRYLKSKKSYKLIRQFGYAKKQKAIAKAIEWSEKGL